jgi:hypothetical protein
MSGFEKFELAKRIASSPWYVKRNILARKSFTFRYLFYRIMRPLLKLNYKIFKWTRAATPWTSPASVKILQQLLDKEAIGFEYGSGMSTLFIAARIRHLTSVEHNEKWFRIVSTKLRTHNFTNIDYHCIPAVTGTGGSREYSFHQDYGLDSQSFRVMQDYHNYFSFITVFPNGHFDFIFIDGRARIECTLNAIPKLKKGGMLVLDNSDRDRYAPLFKVLEHWPRVTTTTGLFDTTIWFKPEAL